MTHCIPQNPDQTARHPYSKSTHLNHTQLDEATRDQHPRIPPTRSGDHDQPWYMQTWYSSRGCILRNEPYEVERSERGEDREGSEETRGVRDRLEEGEEGDCWHREDG